ncbi:MAG: DUF2911 domain-containing protein [Bacteroidota bacterium]
MRLRITLTACLFAGLFTVLGAQELKFGDLDKSPMDAAHYPMRSAWKNYHDAGDPDSTQLMKVLYSRPQKKERMIFGGLVPYGQDWRLGANEATEVTFFRPVEIGNTYVPAGTYTMFAHILPNQWVIKVSTERFIAGTSNRDMSQDIATVTVPTATVGKVREFFTIGFQEVDDNNVNMVFEWDQTRASLPISLNPAMLDSDNPSPMDLVHYPPMSRLRNFVEEDELEENEPQIRVVYSRPQMNDRTIFGGLLEYGEVWRVGANETTEITFFQDVNIDGTDIEAGRYGLFATVNEGNWEYVIHNDPQTWGPAYHDPKHNVATFTAKTEKTPETLEALSMTFVDKGDNMVHLVVGWENTMTRIPIQVKK